MKEKSIGFIGGGRITKILLQAFKNKNVGFTKIVFCDTNADAIQKLKTSFPDIEVQPLEEVAKQDVVFIALHPPFIAETLQKAGQEIAGDAVVVSLAPKITIEKIAALSGNKNVVRLIPNATSYINEGYNPVCFAGGFDPEKKQQMLDTLEILGKTFEVTENKLESYAIVSAMLPTYFWFQWEEMKKIGSLTGMDESETNTAIYETLAASLNLMFTSGLTYAEVVDLIPVKPIAEHEEQIKQIYQTKLMGLFEKIKP